MSLISKKVHVSELRLGMYVSKLDRDWLDTPFLLQGFTVESEDDIDVIHEYCEHVWIEAVNEKRSPFETLETGEYKKRPARYINKLPAQDEHRKAIGVYKASQAITKNILATISLQGTIKTDEAKEVVNECVDSVIRNPNALIWMSKVREVDEYTSEHCLNVCIYAITFGRHLGIDEEELKTLGLCAMLHDVGKMRVPQHILNKKEKLTEREFSMIKAHTVHGRKLLMSTPGMPAAAVDVAYGHHERMDGSGYPRKIKATGISDFSRIVAIVDAYDAMTAERCYAPAMPSTQALNIIFKDRGTHFDEHYAIEFIKCIGLYPPGTLVELNNDRVAIVLAANPKQSRLPKIITVLDENKARCSEKVYNLKDVNSGSLDTGFLIKRALVDGAYGVTIKEYQEQGLIFAK